jgi:hypothetical protein
MCGATTMAATMGHKNTTSKTVTPRPMAVAHRGMATAPWTAAPTAASVTKAAMWEVTVEALAVMGAVVVATAAEEVINRPRRG